MSYVVRKPVYAICDQQRRRSAAHPCSLISAFVVRCLDSIIPRVFISKISSLYLASVVAQAGLCLTWWQTPKIGFLVMRLVFRNKRTLAHTVSKCIFLCIHLLGKQQKLRQACAFAQSRQSFCYLHIHTHIHNNNNFETEPWTFLQRRLIC